MTKYDTSPLAGIGVVGWADLCQFCLHPPGWQARLTFASFLHPSLSLSTGWRRQRAICPPATVRSATLMPPLPLVGAVPGGSHRLTGICAHWVAGCVAIRC